MARTTNSMHAHDRVLAVLQENAASLLRIARRHSLCDDDAQDAYQRALEIYLRRLDRVDAATAGAWLRTVVKHEAMHLRDLRVRTLNPEEVDFDGLVSDEISTGEERAVAFDRVTRAAEALRSCKRDEVAAMVLKADGHSYDEICAVTGWSYTKVNRCLSEGRSQFLKRYAAIEAGEECTRLAPVLSMIIDGEATPLQMAEARPHLRNCAGCRASLRELTESQAAIHVVVPAALVAGAGGFTESAAGLLSRAYETLVAGVHDRLALAAIQAQHAAEAVSASKVAAVAASAAAVAGGGAVALEETGNALPPEKRAARTAAASPEPAPDPAASRPREAEAPAAARPRRRPAARVRVRRERAVPAPTATPAPARPEFGFETAAPAPPAAEPSAAPRGEDFGFER